MKDIILKDIEGEGRDIMSNLYDKIVNSKSTHEELIMFAKTLEISSRLSVVREELARYESYLN